MHVPIHQSSWLASLAVLLLDAKSISAAELGRLIPWRQLPHSLNGSFSPSSSSPTVLTASSLIPTNLPLPTHSLPLNPWRSMSTQVTIAPPQGDSLSTPPSRSPYSSPLGHSHLPLSGSLGSINTPSGRSSRQPFQGSQSNTALTQSNTIVETTFAMPGYPSVSGGGLGLQSWKGVNSGRHSSPAVAPVPSITVTSIYAPSSSNTSSIASATAISSIESLQYDIRTILIPSIRSLIDRPDNDKANDCMNMTAQVKSEVENLFDMIHPAHLHSDSCVGRDITDIVPCIDESLGKIKQDIRVARDNKFSDVNNLANSLSELISVIGSPTEGDTNQSPTTTTATCTVTTTIENLVMKCYTTLFGRHKRAATSCLASTMTTTGCDVTALTTTMATPCSATQKMIECDVTCLATRRAVFSVFGSPTAQAPCTTTCSTATGCENTGVSITSTTTLGSTLGSLEQCGPQCTACVATSPPVIPTSAVTFTDRELPANLFKRTLPAPWDLEYAGNVGDFLVDQYVRAEWVPLAADGGGSAVSSSLFHALQNEPYNMVVRGLYGCTSVVVVSERAVWMSHHWEVPLFSPGNWEIGSQEQFKKGVLDELVNGGPQISGLKQYTKQDGPFAPHYRPAAYIVRPEGSGRADYDKAYDAKVHQIIDTVKNVLGVGTPPLPIMYARSGGDNAASPKGKILFQYDPAQDYSHVNAGCSIQKAMERVWVEDKPKWIHQRYWAAYDDQIVFNSHWKRDSCPISHSVISMPSLPSSVPGHQSLGPAIVSYSALPSSSDSMASRAKSWGGLSSSLSTEATVRPLTRTRGAMITPTGYGPSATTPTKNIPNSTSLAQSENSSAQVSETSPGVSDAVLTMSDQSRPTTLKGRPTSMSSSETMPFCYIDAGPHVDEPACVCTDRTSTYYASTMSNQSGANLCAYPTPPPSISTTRIHSTAAQTTIAPFFHTESMVVTYCAKPTPTYSEGLSMIECGDNSTIVETLHPQPGTATLHVYEAWETAAVGPIVYVAAVMKDIDGVVVANRTDNSRVRFGETLTVPVMNYPKDSITIEASFIYGTNRKRTPIGAPPRPMRVDHSYLKFQANGFSFDTKHDSDTEKGRTLPYCKIGEWDHGSALEQLKDFLDIIPGINALGSLLDIPDSLANRQMDCYIMY